MTRRAKCCCGQRWIEVRGSPALNAICHCSNCKQRTGSAFGWSAYFEDRQVTEMHGDVRVYQIGGANPQSRSFCANCGTTLFWKVATFMPGHVGVAGGCFTDELLEEPRVSVSNDGRCAWVGLPSDWRTSLRDTR